VASYAHVAVVLWHIEISHYNEKARWALDYKGVPYELRVPMPGFHGLTALRLTHGRHRRLPVAEIDGRRIGDSTAIIAALEEYAPEPALYPADPQERARALALEDWFDENLAPELRRFVWHHTLPDTELTARTLFKKPDPKREQMLRRAAPVARFFVRRDYRVTAATAAEARVNIVAAMERLESELQPSGYLVGDGFTVADLTAAALFTPLVAPPERPYAPAVRAPAVQELKDELEARPGGEWIMRMYRLHRGAPVPQEAHAVGG
jgi:glutathione S-transferase